MPALNLSACGSTASRASARRLERSAQRAEEMAALSTPRRHEEALKAEEEAKLLDEMPEEDEGDSREERAFRMWINSLGLDECFVINLFDDVRDGWVLLQVMPL